MKILALDIGGTAVKYGLFDGDDVLFGKFPVIDEDGTERLPEKILKFLAEQTVDCVGICAPGPFDFKTGTGLMTHKLPSLYNISLKKCIEEKFPCLKTVFIHDSTAFVLGEICINPIFSDKNIAAVMLGTGLGYIHAINGKVELNEKETPLKPLWNKEYKDSTAENYVSATAIIRTANELGFAFNNVLDISKEARDGNEKLLKIFCHTGMNLGEMINDKIKEDSFKELVIGGQVSLSWDLMKTGFEKICSIPYHITINPATTALYGIKYCVEQGKENVCLRG